MGSGVAAAATAAAEEETAAGDGTSTGAVDATEERLRFLADDLPSSEGGELDDGARTRVMAAMGAEEVEEESSEIGREE